MRSVIDLWSLSRMEDGQRWYWSRRGVWIAEKLPECEFTSENDVLAIQKQTASVTCIGHAIGLGR